MIYWIAAVLTFIAAMSVASFIHLYPGYIESVIKPSPGTKDWWIEFRFTVVTMFGLATVIPSIVLLFAITIDIISILSGKGNVL
jgi:hypothetical protein